ncbi:hypothetical protein HU200_064820 [Digitaria exilis]|uniref:Uncharacterized protein n=1 Tax=Digitaria exilis TaxID=1010633 RepID=A0A835DYA3_9POAL|nr:hypothetical protein HU200_064820 [Digitaria exilis]
MLGTIPVKQRERRRSSGYADAIFLAKCSSNTAMHINTGLVEPRTQQASHQVSQIR